MIAVFIPTSVVSIGSSAFAYCSSLKAVVILSTSISLGSDAFIGDSALTRLNATEKICVQVRNSCRDTCTQFRQCPIPSSDPIFSETNPYRSPAPASGLSEWAIAVIVIFVIMVLFTLLLRYRWSQLIYCTDYSVVEQQVEMQSTPGQRTEDNIIEAHALPQGELLVTLDQASPFPAATAVVVRSTEPAVVVLSHELVITSTTTTTVSEEIV
eukprot:gene34142-44112_t